VPTPTAPDRYRLALPLLHLLPAETAHRLALWALKHGLVPAAERFSAPVLNTRIWNLNFPNPVGLAAGFDKNGEAADALLGFGFGFVEVGTVTPRPQPGNPRPRLFRLTEDGAIVNRMGFNNRGMEAMARRLAGRKAGTGIVGINLGKNKDSEDAAADYAAGAGRLAPLADYLVINVSSPNTPGLRALQGRDRLSALVKRTRAAYGAGGRVPPLLVKIAPDLEDADLADIATLASNGLFDGLIVSNTTIARPDHLTSAAAGETGGLSGAPLFEPSTRLLRRIYAMTRGKVPLIGVGGIASGLDAYVKIRAGASLVQIYSAMIYQGPGLVGRITRDLADLLTRDGFTSVAQAVGADHRLGRG
jgi:dihydroorotate dehydrogenase